MTQVPDSPQEFFQDYLPGWFAAEKPGSITSPGALVFHVGSESYSLRLAQGALEVTPGAAVDAILQASLSRADFAALVTQGSALFSATGAQRALALRSLELDAERAKLLRSVDGSVAFEITDGDQTRTLLLTPGAASAGSAPPACTVRAAAADFWALSRGEKNPFELLMDGKIRIQGRAEVAMALSSVLMT